MHCGFVSCICCITIAHDVLINSVGIGLSVCTVSMLRLSPKVLQAYNHSSRICFLRFFENPKKRDFLRFFEAAFQKKRKKRNP